MNDAAGVRSTALGLGLLLAVGCTEPAETGPGSMVRLADLLEHASIASPVTEVEAARRLEELGELRREPVLYEDFSAFDPAAAGWTVSENGVLVGSDDSRAFLLRRHDPADRRMWVVGADPGAHYLFGRRVQTTAPLDADFAVVEAMAAEAILPEEAGPFALGEGGALQMHWPEAPAQDGAWQPGEVSFLTTPFTRALGVVLRGTGERRANVLRWGAQGATDHEARFDDIRLDRVHPTPRQMVALLKARSPAEGANAALGVAKHGQFLPLSHVGSQHRPEDDNFSYRYALYAPPPAELAFPVEIEAGAVLRFSVCLAKETPLGAKAEFEVRVRADGTETTVWEQTLAAVQQEWRWHPARVDLSAFAGQRVDLVLVTRAEKGHPHPMWGNPVVDTPPASAGPRNVILIAIDTLRADRLSCYGYERETSPHIDALAADGVRFDQVASNSNWTCPAFASVFTGVVPARHGVWASGPIIPLPARFETLAERFRAHGWATQSIAYKPVLYSGGYEQGFDVAFNVPRTIVRADHNLAEAVEWLEANADRRNFLFLHFDDPHQPFCQPPPFDRKFGPPPSSQGVGMPAYFDKAFVPKGPLRTLAHDLYDGEVAYVDDRIGVFLGMLRERGLYDDAVIALVSDHGEALWEHGLFGHGGGKLHDEVVRVPLIVKPGRGDLARAAVSPTQVRLFDVMPTLLELAEIPGGEGLDAESLVPLMRKGGQDARDRLAVIETNKNVVAVRDRQWKYILRYRLRNRAFASEALFDLQVDPGEKDNVAAEHEDVVVRMRRSVLDYFLVHRPGRYVVAIAEPGDAVEQSIDGVISAGAFFGIQPEVADRGATFRGTSPGRIAFVAELEVEVEEGGPEFARYQPGGLDELVDGGPGLHFFSGPPREGDAPDAAQSLDLRQLEALKALGYTGDGGTPGDDK